MSKPILPAAVIVVVLLTCTVVTAEAVQLMVDPAATGDVAVRDIDHPLAAPSMTQNIDPNTLVDGTSVACWDGVYTTENSWLRLFDMDADHGFPITFTLANIEWGVQNASGALNVTLNAYCLDDGLPFLLQFLTFVGTTGPIPVADEQLMFHSNPITGSCDGVNQSLAVEIFAEDCNIADCTAFFVGMNDLGQTAPTYIASGSCGVTEPTDLAGLGFPNAHLVMVVNGEGGDPPDDGGGDPDVPATTNLGAVVLLLILLGSGAYFLRGRVTG